jgi:hypothetical protein
VTLSTKAQGLVPAVAAALLLSASPALAGVRSDDRPGPHGVQTTLDPRAHNVLHAHASEMLTEHSAGQNAVQPRAIADPPGQNRVREKLDEIGAWAVPSTSKEKRLASESQQTTIREKLGEIGSWAVPMGEGTTGQHAATSTAARPDDRAGIRGPSAPTALSQLAQISDHGAFNWLDASIGALAALIAMLLATSATLLAFRRRRASQPIGGLSG